MKRLYRSENDRMIAGVCGGIAEYLNVDPTLVRVGFVLLGLWAAGVVLYLALWLIVPTASGVAAPADETVRTGVGEMRTTAQRAARHVRDTVRGR